MKRFIATLALLSGLTQAAPITMLDVPDDTVLYDSSDPFAIGVSTAAYIAATNALGQINDITANSGTTPSTVTNIVEAVTARDAVAKSATNGWETGAHQAWLLPPATNGLATEASLSGLSNTLSIAIAAPSDALRLISPDASRWIDATGGVWQVTQQASTEYVDLVFSADFATTNGHSPVSRRIVLPYSSGTGQTFACDSDGVYWAIHATIGWYGLGIVDLEHFYNTPNYIKLTAQTRDGSFQPVRPAVFNYISGAGGPPNGTAQIETHYDSVTSALPRVAFVSDVPSTNGLASTAYVAGAITSATGAMTQASSGISFSSALVPIVAVTTGAVTTVEWSATPRINYIELATPTTITNSLANLANLGNCTSNAEVEVWLNATATNALAPVWDSRLIWQDGPPDLTVTGLYKFAFSSACGTNFLATQISPPRIEWQKPTFQSAVGAALAGGTYYQYPTTGTNVAYFMIPFDARDLKVYVKAEIYNTGANESCRFFSGYSPSSTAGAAVGQTYYVTNDIVSAAANTYTQIKYAFAPNGFSHSLAFMAFTTGSGIRLPVTRLYVRRLNHLEESAYNAGWRP